MGDNFTPLPLVGFPLITSKRQMLQPWDFAAFSNILLETLVSNLLFPTCPSLQILSPDGGIFDFRISGQSFIKENCHNSSTINDIDMKPGPVAKLDKRNKSPLKKYDAGTMSENHDVIVIFPIYG